MAAKPARGSITGDALGKVQSSKKKERQGDTTGWLGSQHGVDNMGPKGSQQGADGLQRGTLIRYVGPMWTVKATPMVGNVEP